MTLRKEPGPHSEEDPAKQPKSSTNPLMEDLEKMLSRNREKRQAAKQGSFMRFAAQNKETGIIRDWEPTKGQLLEKLQQTEKLGRERSQRLQSDSVELLTVLSLGLDPKEQKLRRYIPVNLYVAESGLFGEGIRLELERFLKVFSFELDDLTPLEFGSVHWRPRFYTQDRLTNSDLESRLRLVESSVTTVIQARPACAVQSEDKLDEARKKWELAHLQAEVGNLRAETLKTYLEAAHKLIFLLLSFSVGVSIAIGTIRIEKVNISPEKQEIKMNRISPETAITKHSEPTQKSEPVTIEEETEFQR